MAVPIRMPDLGTTVEEFRIMRWLVAEGDTVSLGDELIEIETDKAVTALESTAKGVLLRRLVNEDDVAHTGDILAYVGQPGETIPDTISTPQATIAEPAAQTAVSAEVISKPVQVAPVVRNLAAKLGVDLSVIQGTGQGGVITREDVQRAAQQAAALAPQATTALSRGQAAVARAVSKSWTEIPHTFFTASIDMSAARQVRDEAKATGVAPSYDAFFLRAMALALRQMPEMGARWQDDRLIPLQGIHLALAVGNDNDLWLPVLRDVDKQSLAGLQLEITETAQQARQQNLPSERLTGACMALSNLGMFAVESFAPIIFPGHSAMLAIGTMQPTPVVVDGQIVIRPLMKATLAVDHRVINGRLAAAFLTQIKTLIESGEIR